ncbi:hypothetical protein F7R01_12150 [Pseudomonas argentinensis]|nr:hypothetical protein F7R01_12150 [Pseudomonas argentinensis]
MTCEGHPAFLIDSFCATFSGHTKAESLQEKRFFRKACKGKNLKSDPRRPERACISPSDPD